MSRRVSRKRGSKAVPDVWDLLGIRRRPPAREAMLEIGRLFHLLHRNLSERFGAFGITPPQYGVLEMLDSAPDGVEQDELWRRLLCSRPNLKGLVDRLLGAGHVTISRHAVDRRRRIVRLAPSGKKLVLRIRSIYRRSADGILSPLSSLERRQLCALLRRVREPLEIMKEGEKP